MIKKNHFESKLPIKMWLDDLEDGALEQAKNLANLPFAFKHIAIMPDSHQGYGMPIGAVLATRGAVIPNAVGADIGCGMCVAKSNIQNINRDKVKEVFAGIRSAIPVGFNWHKESQYLIKDIEKDHTDLITPLLVKADKQVGTLGGGNHFIELQQDQDGFLYIMIHSGSRNLGANVAEQYNKKAKELNSKWHSIIEDKWDLAFLPLDTKEAKDYMIDMEYCMEFARLNRFTMMKRAMACVNQVFIGTNWGKIINEPHNFVRMENHFGSNVMVHRKGATSAKKGELGMIPGSQGTPSYIVKGRGNSQSFNSCSHGAGRKMGRNQAIKELGLESEISKLDDLGIVHSIRHRNDLQEAPSAYKDIEDVIENQEDLIEVIEKLYPIGVIKG